jgi:SSS family solute:Na+ symporter
VVALVSIVVFPTLPNGYSSTEAYPLVMNEFLGAGLKGLLITAFLAAFMSTIDTHLNWGASYIMTDVYSRFIKKDATNKHYMKVAKIVVVLMMLAGAAIVPFLNSITEAMEFLAFLLTGSGIISVVRWFWWRINAYTEISALAIGLICAFTNLFIPDSFVIFGYTWTELPFEIKVALFNGINIPISIFITYLTRPVSTEKLEKFYIKVRPGGFWKILSPEIRNLPDKAFGWGTFVDVTGGIMLCYGISLAIGYSILLSWTKVCICTAMAITGAILVHRWYKKEVHNLKEIQSTPQQETHRGDND